MDDPMDSVEESPGGISRRDMIKASVIAGGLVWTAPVLLTGKAAAAPGQLCCEQGTAITFKVSSGSGSTCGGSGCLDTFVSTTNPPTVVSFGCPPGLLQCLTTTLGFVRNSFQGTQTATVTLDQGITLIAASVKGQNMCFYTICPCFPKSDGTCSSGCPSSSSCLNTCQQQGNNNSCNSLVPPNRITVSTSGSTTVVTVNLQPGDGNIDFLQLSICVPQAVTGMCPH